MTVLTFRDVSKFSSVNTYIGGIALGLYFNRRNLLQQDLYRNEIETIIYSLIYKTYWKGFSGCSIGQPFKPQFLHSLILTFPFMEPESTCEYHIKKYELKLHLKQNKRLYYYYTYICSLWLSTPLSTCAFCDCPWSRVSKETHRALKELSS